MVPKIHHALKQMHDFIFESYKGVYCSICDAKTHTLFNVENKEITLGEGFCRAITSNSLHALIYFQLHLKKLSELAATFVTSCNQEGEFNPQETVPGNVLMEVQEADKQILTECRSFRNDAGWLQYCGKICEKFHLTQFSEFFQPDIKKYHKMTVYLGEQLTKFSPPEESPEEENKEEEETEEDKKKKEEEEAEKKKKDEEEEKLKQEEAGEETPAEARSLRRLRRYLKEEAKEDTVEAPEGDGIEDEGEEGEETLVDLEKKFEKMDILQKSMNAVVPMDKIKCLFADPGIDIYEIGKLSKITEENYKLVNALGHVKEKKTAKVVKEEFVKLVETFVFGILTILYVIN